MTADPARVLVVGGGPGGLEAVLALQAQAGDRVRPALLSAEPHFTYRPWAVAEPFGLGSSVRVDLAAFAFERGVELHHGAVRTVDADARRVHTDDDALDYDVLVLALGARPSVAVPGALTFRGPQDATGLRIALRERAHHHGARIAYVAGPSCSWPLPAYELALMTTTWGRREGVELDVCIVTAEHRALEAFGEATSGEVADLLRARGVALHVDAPVESYHAGCLTLPMGATIPADLAVALPALTGPAVEGLPGDALGFVPVDDLGRVEGLDDVYAVGDMTARALKQGGLAAQQADVAAAAIAAGLGATVPVEPYHPVLRAMLLTGEAPVFLRHPAPPAAPRPSSTTEAPWWPPHKIAGAHLAPYLATHAELLETVTADAR